MIDPESYDLCMETARVALARGDRRGAEESLRAAIRATDREEDSQSKLAAALIRLGELKQEASSDLEAEEMFRHALEVGERALGADDLRIVPALTSLGALRIAKGKPEDAEPLLTRALTISERQLGRDHPDLVVLLNDLSRLYLKQGAYAFAEPLLIRLHAIKRSKGEDHPEVATVLASLATVRQALGRHDAAEQLWRRVVEIRERTLAPNHFAIVSALEHLAETCAARAKTREALRLFQRALAMRELTLGAEHPSLRGSRERIADLQLQASEEEGEETGQTEVRSPATDWRTSPGVDPGVPARVAVPDPVPSYPLSTLGSETRSAFEHEPAQRLASPASAARPTAPAESPTRLTAALEPAQRQTATLDPAEPSPLRLFAVGAPGQAPASVIMPSFKRDLALDDENWDVDVDYAKESRGGAMSALAAVARNRSAQVGVAVVGGVAVVLLALGAGSNAQTDGGQFTTAQGEISRQAFPVAPVPSLDSAALASGSGAQGSTSERAANGESDAKAEDAASSPATTSRGPAPRASSKTAPASSSEVTATTTLPNPVLSRSLPRGASAQVDSVMRAMSVAPAAIGPSAAPEVSFTSGGTIGGSAAVPLSTRITQPVRMGPMPRIPFPSALLSSGGTTSGSVLVEFAVDTTGRPDLSTVKILATDHALFSSAVRKAIPSMRFAPAEENGRKVRGLVQVPFRFSAVRD